MIFTEAELEKLLTARDILVLKSTELRLELQGLHPESFSGYKLRRSLRKIQDTLHHYPNWRDV